MYILIMHKVKCRDGITYKCNLVCDIVNLYLFKIAIIFMCMFCLMNENDINAYNTLSNNIL